jgi:hypothetical protein
MPEAKERHSSLWKESCYPMVKAKCPKICLSAIGPLDCQALAGSVQNYNFKLFAILKQYAKSATPYFLKANTLPQPVLHTP